MAMQNTMMQYTEYLKLNLPGLDDFVDITLLNNNFWALDTAIASETRHLIAQRSRAPTAPDYGLGGAVVLRTAPYSGGAEIALQLNNGLFDAENITARPESAPSGTMIVRKMEE